MEETQGVIGWNVQGSINKKRETRLGFSLAVRTGLEPVTPCVTGMYSNQLN